MAWGLGLRSELFGTQTTHKLTHASPALSCLLLPSVSCLPHTNAHTYTHTHTHTHTHSHTLILSFSSADAGARKVMYNLPVEDMHAPVLGGCFGLRVWVVLGGREWVGGSGTLEWVGGWMG